MFLIKFLCIIIHLCSKTLLHLRLASISGQSGNMTAVPKEVKPKILDLFERSAIIIQQILKTIGGRQITKLFEAMQAEYNI